MWKCGISKVKFEREVVVFSVRSHIEMEELKLYLHNTWLDKTSFQICSPLASIPFILISGSDSFSSAAWLLHPRTAWRPGVFWGLELVPGMEECTEGWKFVRQFWWLYHSFYAGYLQYRQPY